MTAVSVTPHARQRILERLGCSPAKVQKVAEKAWLAREPDPKRVWQRQRSHPGAVFRDLMGYVFVFYPGPEPRLLTVFLPPTRRQWPEEYPPWSTKLARQGHPGKE